MNRPPERKLEQSAWDRPSWLSDPAGESSSQREAAEKPGPFQGTTAEKRARRWIQRSPTSTSEFITAPLSAAALERRWRAAVEQKRRRKLEERISVCTSNAAVVVLGLAMVQLGVTVALLIDHEMDRRLASPGRFQPQQLERLLRD